MILSSIVAMGKNRVIGKDNQMMWNIPSEYRFYREKRGDHYFIIGRKNYEGSLGIHQNAKAIILTRQEDYQCIHPCFNNLSQAINFAKEQGEDELFIIGGSEIYELAMPFIDRLYLSTVDFNEEGDAYFPPHEHYNWKTIDHFKAQEDSISWEFSLLEKKPEIVK